MKNRRVWATIIATIMIITIAGCRKRTVYKKNDFYFDPPSAGDYVSEQKESEEDHIYETYDYNYEKETTTEKPTEQPTTKPAIKPTEPSTTKPATKPTEQQTTKPEDYSVSSQTTRQPVVVNKTITTYPELYGYSYVTEADILTVRSIIRSLIYTDMSTIERIKTVHDYLIKKTTYDTTYYQKNDTHNHLYNILNENRAVCQGYAVAFYIFMKELDIPCSLVAGYAKGESHAWNAVKLDGKWYFIDLTWDDPIIANDMGVKTNDYPNGENISYIYFLCTNSFISRTNIAEEYINDMPTTYGNSNEYNNYALYQMGYKGVYRIDTAKDLNCVSQVTESGEYIFINQSDEVSADTIMAKIDEYIRATNRGAKYQFNYSEQSVNVIIEYKS